jgi:DNA-binding NtrC family response regulator
MSQILLVDDDAGVLITLAIALRRQGHVVTAAQNAWQALSLLKKHRYAFLISDVVMPGMTGIGLAQRVHRLAHPPKIILTSALDIDIAPDVIDAFLPKPVDVGRLGLLLGEGLLPTETGQPARRN